MEGDTGEEEAELLLQSGGGGVWRVLSNAEHTRKGSRAVRNKTEKEKEEKKKEERKGANEAGKPAQTYISIIILLMSKTKISTIC